MCTEEKTVDEYFQVDEVAMMRFMSMCQQSCDPKMLESFKALCHQLIGIRHGLRSGCFERIEAYLDGSASKWSPSACTNQQANGYHSH